MTMKRLLRRLGHLIDRFVPGLITCAEADAFIDDYLDDRLPPDTRKRFERHIRLCRPCSSYLEAYRRSVALAKAGADPVPRPQMPEELVQAILAARKHERD